MERNKSKFLFVYKQNFLYLCFVKQLKPVKMSKSKFTNLERLQKLCNIVNRRYASEQNDDDQVAHMYKFEKSVSDVRVIIGWDDYQAMSVEQLEEEFKTSKEITKDEFYVIKDHKRYKCILPIKKILDMYYHVVKTENKIEIVPSEEVLCEKVENSICSFINRGFAVTHANQQFFK